MSDEPIWCLYTQTEGGTVSVIRGLTAGEAREAGRLATPRIMWPDGPDSYCLHGDPSRIEIVKVYNGAGEHLNIWEGWEPK